MKEPIIIIIEGGNVSEVITSEHTIIHVIDKDVDGLESIQITKVENKDSYVYVSDVEVINKERISAITDQISDIIDISL